MNIQGNAEIQKTQKVVEHPQRDESTGFDYRVHIRDAKTGRLTRIQHYARHSRGGEVLLERPVGSGNCFFENGELAGRWDLVKWAKLSDKHLEVAAAPMNREEELEEQNEMLRLELEALKAEHQPAQQQGKKKD